MMRSQPNRNAVFLGCFTAVLMPPMTQYLRLPPYWSATQLTRQLKNSSRQKSLRLPSTSLLNLPGATCDSTRKSLDKSFEHSKPMLNQLQYPIQTLDQARKILQSRQIYLRQSRHSTQKRTTAMRVWHCLAFASSISSIAVIKLLPSGCRHCLCTTKLLHPVLSESKGQHAPASDTQVLPTSQPQNHSACC